MNLTEALTESVESLRRNRLRSGLTMLGIVWGLVTVVLLLSYGRAVGNAVMEGFLGFGNNVIMVWGGQTSMQAGGERSGQKIHFREGDMEAVRDSLPFLSAVSRETDDNFSVKYGPKVDILNLTTSVNIARSSSSESMPRRSCSTDFHLSARSCR
jgi:putative ABC transport system permease protein